MPPNDGERRSADTAELFALRALRDYKMPDTPFETIESAQEYVRLLASEVQVVRADIDADLADSFRVRADRRVDALRIVDYKLKQLEQQLGACSRILNDLRMLRRLLVSERETVPAMVGRQSDTGRR